MKEFSWKNRKQSLISFLILIILWEVLAININKEIYLPRIEKVILAMFDILKSEGFINNLFSSLYRTLISFTSALVLSIILGILSLMYPFFRNFLRPINAIGKTIPTMVLVLLALIWFDKDKAPYVVGFAIVFPILYEGILSSLKEIDKKLLDMCKVYRVSTKEKILKIYISSMLFYIMGILISTLSLAFKVVIAGEVHGQPDYGIGAAIQLEKMNFNTTAIFAWIFIIALLSLLFEGINKLFIKRVYKWRDENEIAN